MSAIAHMRHAVTRHGAPPQIVDGVAIVNGVALEAAPHDRVIELIGTSLIAALSSARSAHMRLSLAFSPSSSSMHRSVVPAYLDRHTK